MKTMCEFFGVSRAAYHEWVRKLGEVDPDQERMEQVQTAYEASHKAYGYRRITIPLQQKMGIWINHKAVLRLTLAPTRKCRCEQIEHSFPSQKTQNAQKTGRNWHLPPLP